MKRICVFCGAKTGNGREYRDAAHELGRVLVSEGVGLVFGGGSVGLMGVLADVMLEAGGEVVGVIPERLATKELRHTGVTTMHVVESMHARKALMAQLADAFIALPGGLGTFEELFEVLTWAQLGFHSKSTGLLNVAGYFDPLMRLIDHAAEEGFLKPACRELLCLEERPEMLLTRLRTHQMPHVKRWLGPDET